MISATAKTSIRAKRSSELACPPIGQVAKSNNVIGVTNRTTMLIEIP
jgi:hypothetical protein